jgi:transposase
MCGRKRHLVVDMQGLVLHVLVHPAGVHDRRAAETVLDGLKQRYPDVACLFADMGYQGLGFLALGRTRMDAADRQATTPLGLGPSRSTCA